MTLVFEYWYYKYRKGSKVLIANNVPKMSVPNVQSMKERYPSDFIIQSSVKNSKFNEK